jgi:ATP-dependent Clp protease ATP-binding subunit ClpC
MGVLMDGPKFDYSSLRARRARLAHHFAHKEVYWMSIISGWVMAASGILIVWLFDVPLGWLLAGLAGPFWMIAEWSRALMHIPPRSQGRSIDDILDADVLGVLPAKHAPRQLAAIVMGLPGGRFFGARFGLGGDFLATSTTTDPADSSKVWDEASRLSQASGQASISSAALAAALIRTIPNIDQLLARAHMGKDDITAGLEWYNQLQAAIAAHSSHHPDGGIGRDWAFGYTPLLARFGMNVSQHVTGGAPWQEGLESRHAIMKQMVHLLSQAGRRNATLVGGLGSGKTSMVYALAKKLLDADPSIPQSLHYRQVVSMDPSALIAQARGRGELEGLVQRLIHEAISAKNIILFLDDAELFFEDANGSINLSNILLPVLEGGALPLILAMDEQRWLKISQSNPGLVQHMNRVIVQPMDESETMLVMRDQFMIYEYQQKATYTYPALQETYRLSSRYMSEQVMPGRALKLLEAAAGLGENGLVTHRSVQQAIEQTQGVKVGTADSVVEKEKLLNLEKLIHERMINQTHAVQVVSDALRRARAGVRNTGRPIGTFLFLGPTGVGKTELAKSVAAVFFGGEDNLVRLDLNEYVRPDDVSRLIADGAQDPRSLTAQISKKPFSVVLLDEIEKAHPNVLNTLLQMLDEGILRDINNREVSFRDAVVVATSNAGAERIRQHIDAGEQLEQFAEQFTNELINANIFRPEFLNRFDEIVLFRPLKQQELLEVIDIILKGVNKNLSAQKVSVVVDAAAKHLLVEHGYDPRLGARPLRRVVQRVVENIVSNQLLQGQAGPGSQINIGAEQVKSMLERSNES